MKYISIQINAARKNPELNVKVSMVDQLRPYSKNSRAFITFTTLNKVGLNPSSNFNTPLGIYAYPLRAFWRNIEDNDIPFASDRPYVSLLLVKRNAKILNNNYSWDDLEKDQAKLYEFCKKEKFVLSKQEFIDIRDIGYQKYPPMEEGKPIFYIWSLTRYIANRLVSGEDNINHITKWNYVFREVLGYEGAIDFRGYGFIHPNEPKQAVFFSVKAFSETKTMLNRRYEKPTLPFDPKKFAYTKFAVIPELVDEIISINPYLGKKTFYASGIYARPVKNRGVIKININQGTIEKGTILKDCILGNPLQEGKNASIIKEVSKYLIVGAGSKGREVKLINCKIISNVGYYINTIFEDCIINGGFINVVDTKFSGGEPCKFINCKFKKTSSTFTLNGFTFVDVIEYKVSPSTVIKTLNSLFSNKTDLSLEEANKLIDILKEKVKATDAFLRPRNEEALKRILLG